jgi:chromosome segregation ATPase
MQDDVDSRVPVYLRRLDEKMDRLNGALGEVKQRLTALEIQVESFAATEQSHYASLALRLDALEARIDRVERRLDLLPAA